MLDVNEKETVRRAVLVDEKSQRQVVRETGHSRNTIRRLQADGAVPRYRLKQVRTCPALGHSSRCWKPGLPRMNRNRNGIRPRWITF